MVFILYVSVRHLRICSWSATPAWSSQNQDKLKRQFSNFSGHQRHLWSWLSYRFSLSGFLISQVWGEKGQKFEFLTSMQLMLWMLLIPVQGSHFENHQGRAQMITFLVAQTVKRLPTMRKTQVKSLGWEGLLEKEMATHSSILAWKIPWTEEPGG